MAPIQSKSKPLRRGDQIIVPGLGLQLPSPKRKRTTAKHREQVMVLGQAAMQRQLLERIRALKAGKQSTEEEITPPANSSGNSDLSDTETLEHMSSEHLDEHESEPKPRRTEPNDKTIRLYDAWRALLPTLIEPLLNYQQKNLGVPPEKLPEIIQPHCTKSCETSTDTKILCLFVDHLRYIEVQGCDCHSIQQLLVANGLFPTAPKRPRTAVSIQLLEFYHALFEQSANAVNALAGALITFYTRRGYDLVDSQGNALVDPFRRGIGNAIQWHDSLRILVEKRAEETLVSAHHALQRFAEAQTEAHDPLQSFGVAQTTVQSTSRTTTSSASKKTSNLPWVQVSDECARTLQSRCPACFGGSEFGRDFTRGGDFHIAVDGNFHHRQRKTAGNTPFFYEAEYIISKSQVDIVGERIVAARKKPGRNNPLIVPDDAVDECQRSHDAANEDTAKSDPGIFRSHGLMALVCRHDIPLFAANIDTPGEQQKYAVSLIEHFFTQIPSKAMVVVLYDIGCVLDRSLHIYDIMDSAILTRLVFVTSAMHAYGHQWACQLVYNPRMHDGIGLTDGEGVERLWSRMRKLIGITRGSGASKRLWLIDRQLKYIGNSLLDDLGAWIHRRYTQGVQMKEYEAQRELRECGIAVEELKVLWADQKQTQLSIRAHAPARLKREINLVLALQTDLDKLQNGLDVAVEGLKKINVGKEAIHIFPSLESSCEELKGKIDSLYASLNIHEKFPQLNNVSLPFIRVLLLARDLKINIRQRAIGAFFEWDKLDQAVGGAQAALGTKLHQQTRKAISKRKPALLSAIRKYNSYCEQLEALYEPGWDIPLPEPLPIQMTALRKSQDLLEDVWIHQSSGKSPRWLDELEVRDGIRAMLKHDRCKEEKDRLALEVNNMCHWFVREVAAINYALQIPEASYLSVPLKLYHARLMQLPSRWSSQQLNRSRLTHLVDEALITSDMVMQASNITPPPSTSLKTILLPILEPHDVAQSLIKDLDDDVEEDIEVDTTTDQAVLADLLDAEVVQHDDLHHNDKSIHHNHDDDELGAELDTCIEWTLKDNLQVDHEARAMFAGLHFISDGISSNSNRSRQIDRCDGARLIVTAQDMDLLRNPTSWLNDVCINTIAVVLQNILSSTTHPSSLSSLRCAFFDTHTLVHIRQEPPDEKLWQQLSHTQYWLKDIWILPIHRPHPESHWVLCVAYLNRHEFTLYDSFGSRRNWSRDLKRVSRLLTRLVLIANRRGHQLHLITEGWLARPVCIRAVQTNSYDCGLWVIAGIAAALRGFCVTGMQEEDMPFLRKRLLYILENQPVHIPRRERQT